MLTEEYLGQIEKLDVIINNKILEITQLRESIISISVSSKNINVQTAKNQDPLGSSVARLVDMEHEVDALIDDMIDKRSLLVKQIDSFIDDDPMTYNILFLRFVAKKKIVTIAEELHYSTRHVLRLCQSADKAFEDKYGILYLSK